MKPRALMAGLTLLLLCAGLLPREASAIPVFARKYGFNCTMCHSNMPRLNDFGQRYRANGYRLPGRENIELSVLESPPPLALRTSAGFNGSRFNAAAGAPNSGTFELNGLDLLSAGLLGRNIGYLMVYVPEITGGRGVAEQQASLEMASVVFSGLARNRLGLRVGRFEPAYVAFSVKRSLTASPYEIYEAAFPGGTAFSETRSGLELAAQAGTAVRGFVGLLTGGATDRPYDAPADVYGRVAAVIGAGEGQTAGQRFGAVAYAGRARPEAGPGKRASFQRFGGDASLNASRFNLALAWLLARDDNALWDEEGEDDTVTWSGGFAELSWLPLVNLVGFARYDRVNAPDFSAGDIDRMTFGGRWYFEDNVAVHAEFSRRTIARDERQTGDDATESFFTTRLDVAF